MHFYIYNIVASEIATFGFASVLYIDSIISFLYRYENECFNVITFREEFWHHNPQWFTQTNAAAG